MYRAKDTKLKRDVAIKILPDEFSRDHDRVSRFQREAEALAALNHQNKPSWQRLFVGAPGFREKIPRAGKRIDNCSRLTARDLTHS